jgi:Histidine kinase-, DNA gyrase B-, and HSP90-like ATPase
LTMATRKVDITPDVSLLRKAGEVNYKIPDAAAELVDNPLDEQEPGKKLTIEVTVGQRGKEKYLQVADNARGMTPEQAAEAMVMARSRKDKGKIGQFGMGMKTACSNLGARFEIVTCTAEAEKATRILYDEEEFLRHGKWEIELEEVDKPFEHGTVVVITKPKTNLYAGVKDTMLKKFGKLFKHYIASGTVEILVNNDAVEPYMPDTIKEYDLELNFEVNGRLVRGWVGLSKKYSMKGAYGFDLVRHNRVIKEHVQIGFPSGAGYSRIVGELHLDDFPVTNNKTDFRVDTEEWNLLHKMLQERLIDISREARKQANPGRKMTPKDEADVEEYIQDVRETLKAEDLQQDLDRRALDADLADEFAEGPLPFGVKGDEGDQPEEDEQSSARRETPPRPGEPTMVGKHRLNRIKTQLRNLNIEHQIMRLGKDTLYKIWDVEGVGNNKKLVVTTNIDHPFYGVIQDGFMLWVKHNIAEAVAEYFTEEIGRSDAMLLIKSDILKHIGKMKIELIEETGDEGEASAAS